MKKVLKNVALILGFAIIISANVFTQALLNLDEIWIYNFARNIAEGLLPYKDFNIIITPLFPIISSIFIKIFGEEMVVLRFAEVIESTLVLFMAYKVFRKLNVNKAVALIAILGLYYVSNEAFCYDYNWAVLLVTLIIIYLEIKNVKEENIKLNIKKDLLLGILAGTSILLKQSTGLVLALATIGYKILNIRKKEEIKIYLKIVGIRLVGVLIPLAIFAIYLTIFGIWGEFIDYAILGIGTFSNAISYSSLVGNGAYLAYALPVGLIIYAGLFIYALTHKTKVDKIFIQRLSILLVYSLASVCVMYPISDMNHFTIGAMCSYLTAIYLVYELAMYWKREINKDKIIFGIKTFIEAISVLLFLWYIGNSLTKLTDFTKNMNNQEYLNHFKYITTSEGLRNQINFVDEYILKEKTEGKTVYILDTMSAAYTIPIDAYNKNYDMFNVGNFGSKGNMRNN